MRADAELELAKKPAWPVACLEQELEQAVLRGGLTMLRTVENL